MGKYIKKTAVPEIPSPDLSLEELQAAWSRYLDYHVGTAYSPRWEIIVSPDRLEKFLEFVAPEQLTRGAIKRSRKLELFIEALGTAIEKLPLMQRSAVKNYYGITRLELRTQSEIAEELGYSQKTVSKLLSRARKNLKILVRKEMFRLVKEEIQNTEQEEDLGWD